MAPNAVLQEIAADLTKKRFDGTITTEEALAMQRSSNILMMDSMLKCTIFMLTGAFVGRRFFRRNQVAFSAIAGGIGGLIYSLNFAPHNSSLLPYISLETPQGAKARAEWVRIYGTLPNPAAIETSPTDPRRTAALQRLERQEPRTYPSAAAAAEADQTRKEGLTDNALPVLADPYAYNESTEFRTRRPTRYNNNNSGSISSDIFSPSSNNVVSRIDNDDYYNEDYDYENDNSLPASAYANERRSSQSRDFNMAPGSLSSDIIEQRRRERLAGRAGINSGTVRESGRPRRTNQYGDEVYD